MPSPFLAPIELTDAERSALESWAGRPKTAQSLALRCRIVLLASSGKNNTTVAKRWFRDVTTKRIRRGSFGNVGELVTAIEDYIAHNNENPNPFVWTKTAGQIIARVRRGRVALEQVRQSRAI